MAINPINGSTLRLMGLSSGMETDTIIKQMMRISQMRIDTRYRAMKKYEWKQDALNNVSEMIKDFRWKHFIGIGEGAVAMRQEKIYNTTIAVITGPDKSKDAVTVSTSLGTPTGSIRIGQIASLAEQNSVSSSRYASASGDGFNMNEKIGGLSISNASINFDSSTGNADVSINGARIKLNRNDTLDAINTKIRAVGGREIFFSGGYANIDINGKSVFVSENEFYKSELNMKLGEIGKLGSALDYDFAKVNINGTDVMLNRYDSFAQINSKLVAAGGTALSPVGGVVTASINGVDGVEININEADVFGEIDRAIGAAGGTAANLVKFSYAGASIETTSGTYSVFVTAADTLDDINQKIFDSYGVADAISLDGNDKINGVSVGEADFTRKTQVSIETSGVVAKANSTPMLKGFDANGNKTININGVEIEINKDMTIDEMLQKVNSYSNRTGVTMSYSKLSDSFMLKSVSAGASTITTRNMDMFGIGNGSYSGGSNARVWIDDGVTGQWINSNSNTIEFRGGVKITLNHTTDPVVNDNDYLTITFKRDATEALDKIKSFIEGYNSLIQKLEDMLKETKTSAERAYGPLTEEEKSLMTEKQIEDWEAIAKKGVLRSDAGIQSMLSSLRNALYATVKDAGVSPADIGIRTGAGMGGQIILDERGEEALRAALERDPEKVMKAFMGGEKATAYEERGLLWRIDDILQGYEKNSQSATLSNLANSIRRENEQIEKLTKKMWQEEEKLYMKFAAMETAMAKLQDQSDWFMSMLNNTNK